MAVDMFLKLDGVTGESKDKVHSKEIDVLVWSWGMTNDGSAQIGGGAGSGKVNVQDIAITKFVDSSSPQLMLACCKGNPVWLGSARLRWRGVLPRDPALRVKHAFLRE